VTNSQKDLSRLSKCRTAIASAVYRTLPSFATTAAAALCSALALDATSLGHAAAHCWRLQCSTLFSVFWTIGDFFVRINNEQILVVVAALQQNFLVEVFLDELSGSIMQFAVGAYVKVIVAA
jgi:hypothetical protein